MFLSFKEVKKKVSKFKKKDEKKHISNVNNQLSRNSVSRSKCSFYEDIIDIGEWL